MKLAPQFILITITNSLSVLNSILNFVLSLVSWPMLEKECRKLSLQLVLMIISIFQE